MKRRIVLFVIFIFLFAALSAYAAEVKNTVSLQVGSRTQFIYDLIGDEADGEVDVTLTIGRKSYKAADLHLEGASVFKKSPGALSQPGDLPVILATYLLKEIISLIID